MVHTPYGALGISIFHLIPHLSYKSYNFASKTFVNYKYNIYHVFSFSFYILLYSINILLKI